MAPVYNFVFLKEYLYLYYAVFAIYVIDYHSVAFRCLFLFLSLLITNTLYDIV